MGDYYWAYGFGVYLFSKAWMIRSIFKAVGEGATSKLFPGAVMEYNPRTAGKKNKYVNIEHGERGGSPTTLFYDGNVRSPGSLDFRDVKQRTEERGVTKVFCRGISDVKALDFRDSGARTAVIERNPGYGRVYDLLMQRLDVVAELSETAGYSQVTDLKQAERDARAKGSNSQLKVYVIGKNISTGHIGDIVQAGGTPVITGKRSRMNAEYRERMGAMVLEERIPQAAALPYALRIG